MQNYWNKRKFLHKKRVQSPQDCLEHQHGPSFIVLEHQHGRYFYCFWTPTWQTWRRVKTLYSQGEYTDVKYPIPGDNFFGFKKDDLRCIFPYHYQDITNFIIQSKFFFLFIGREPTTWPANKCLQIMVSSCAMSSICVWVHSAHA